jgi:outer membrane protein assembly factor BamA
VRSYFPLSVGKPYSTSRANRGLQDLYGTDLFDRVTLTLLPRDSGAIVDIGVRERKYTQARLGWHWDDTYQSEEFLEVLDDNVAGIGIEYLLHARYSDDRQQYFGELRADRIFKTYLTSQMRLFHSLLDRTTFSLQGKPEGIREEKRTGAFLRVGQQIHRLGMVTAGLQFEEIDLDGDQIGDYSSFSLRTLEFESMVETCDRVPFPETGEKHLVDLRFAGKYLGGDVEYTRFFSSLEGYFPIARNLNYHPKMSVGLSRRGMPPSERFYVGGQESFSGYRTNQLVGDKLFLLNQEFRLRVFGWVYLFAKYDIGNVWESSDQIRLKHLRQGWGGALGFGTPVGPLQFGYGATEDNFDRWYFSLGFTF